MNRTQMQKLVQELTGDSIRSPGRSLYSNRIKLRVELLEDRSVPAQVVYTVNTDGDQPDPTPNDGIQNDCDPNTAGNQYTLRGAIQTANSHTNDAAGADKIIFDLTGGTKLSPASALPTIGPAQGVIGDALIIDGTHGASGRVELDGTNAGNESNGFKITTSNSTITGFVINNFRSSGILIEGNQGNTSRNAITRNYIGTDTAGLLAKPNFGAGVKIVESHHTPLVVHRWPYPMSSRGTKRTEW